MNSTSLIVPFTFLHEQGSDDTHACIGNARNLVEKTCSDARAVFITSWEHRTGTDSDPTQTLTATNSLGGVAIGCEDGTVFILHRPPEAVTPSHLPVDPESRSPSRPSSPLPHGSRRSTSLSRSSTPSSLTSGLSPFTVSPRARIVSGISAEQVQAPKNYVDFDEEPEKLKEYLKSGVRERSVAERFLPHFDKGVTIDKSTAPTSLLSPVTSTVRSTEAKSLLSATQSPALTARSISVPSSPAFLPSTPARDICVISAEDGTCCAFIQIASSSMLPPAGMKDVHDPDGVWTWKRLEVIEIGESVILMACAELDENALPLSTHDSGEGDQKAGSRVTLLDLRKTFALEAAGVELEKIGEWQSSRIVARASFLQSIQSHVEAASTGLSALAFNPFKPASTQEKEPLRTKTRLPGRLEVDAPTIAGEFAPDSDIHGMRIIRSESETYGLVWLDHEVVDRVDVFKVFSVDANTNEVDADIAKAILQSVIARIAQVVTSVSVLGQQAIQITPKADIFFTGVSDKGRRKIQAMVPLEWINEIIQHTTQWTNRGFAFCERLIVGGADDGSVAVWDSDSLNLLARWTIFTTSLTDVVQIRQDKGEPLHGCLLCISYDGTIAVIVLDEYQFLHIVPGSQARLNSICINNDNMLLTYANTRARLWNAKTKEFWRSMASDKVEEMLSQGGWTEVPLEHRPRSLQDVSASLGSEVHSSDGAATVLVDLEQLLSSAISTSKSSNGDDQKNIQIIVGAIRAALGAVLTPGLNVDIDSICRDRLKLSRTSASSGFYSNDSVSLTVHDNPWSAWCVSADASAARALAIVSCLRALGHMEDAMDDASTVVAFYASSLSQGLGANYRPPSLPFLARWWFETSVVELRSAARILFDAGIANLSIGETMTLVERWQHHLPSLQPDAERKLPAVAMALFLCGYIAADNALNDISKSIVLYLQDEDVPDKLLAIDLCSRGFHIWQQYVDAMEMLRSLFTLATASRKDTISSQNIGPQARLAVLQIATHNTALFMTTLSLDILHPRGVESRKSIMQLVAFLIKKKPLVIYPNLPRLVEAVVKSLDPNSTSSREAVLDTATEILGHVVKTFPTVDFHMNSQRLAVGTSEGAVIMYDLKTATRLYVLEGHKKRPAACSFSPDGRRLITVSLEEGLVLVWKVGSSFTSFFNPGAPPRQGRAGSDPFKSLNFNVGGEAHMTIEDTLSAVRVEWAAERSVRLRIRELTLTFST
ncbi:hypothetical protein HETIRDRAFT_445035 [Heterobasidion irregulare TC 32-1]|uniref:Uncharacterized protein n=1 Tax=Heterobasidion irregulare (strain TC 32-1) TaxID=747525 RepID=W4K8V5_HETIT|nr:uncharacterized protein HETIRDRAFT_445035 [Heterobasidion irregulare TC 32-1]ETW82184.1 hypothetical protein HETIRDRAFT_445035 [Heterobasidion irregulare TC 32-1]